MFCFVFFLLSIYLPYRFSHSTGCTGTSSAAYTMCITTLRRCTAARVCVCNRRDITSESRARKVFNLNPLIYMSHAVYGRAGRLLIGRTASGLNNVKPHVHCHGGRQDVCSPTRIRTRADIYVGICISDRARVG